MHESMNAKHSQLTISHQVNNSFIVAHLRTQSTLPIHQDAIEEMHIIRITQEVFRTLLKNVTRIQFTT